VRDMILIRHCNELVVISLLCCMYVRMAMRMLALMKMLLLIIMPFQELRRVKRFVSFVHVVSFHVAVVLRNRISQAEVAEFFVCFVVLVWVFVSYVVT